MKFNKDSGIFVKTNAIATTGLWDSKTHPFDKKNDFILFYTPEAGVLPHFVAQCLLACTLQELGYNVLFLKCNNDLSRCPVLDMSIESYYMSAEEKIMKCCSRCTQIFDALMTFYKLRYVNMSELATEEIRNNAKVSLEKLGNKPQDFEIDGQKIGTLGLADYVLNTKATLIENLPVEKAHICRQYTESSITSYLAVKDLCSRFPVKRICSFNPYAILVSAGLAGETLNIPFLNVTQVAHRDIDRQRFVILPKIYSAQVWKEMINNWYRWRDIPIASELVKEISDDLLIREKGLGDQHYSPARNEIATDLFAGLNLDPDKKILVAFPSSLDELLSLQIINHALDLPPVVENKPYNDQIEWLSDLVKYVESSSDLQLIVRIHPREGSNKRENIISESLSKMTNLYKKAFKNCRFIWPEEPVSSYDLSEIADLGLTSWSTMGLELARKGVPVVTSFRHYTYPDDDFLKWGGETSEEYFSTIRTALEEKPSIDKITRAYRCYNYMNFSTCIKLDDLIPSPSHSDPVEFKMSKEASSIEDIFINGTNPQYINRKKMTASKHSGAGISEHDEVKRQICRLVHLYLTGHDSVELPEMCYVAGSNIQDFSQYNISSLISLKEKALIVVEKDRIKYIWDGKVFERKSMLVARLLPLCCQDEVNASHTLNSIGTL